MAPSVEQLLHAAALAADAEPAASSDSVDAICPAELYSDESREFVRGFGPRNNVVRFPNVPSEELPEVVPQAAYDAAKRDVDRFARAFRAAEGHRATDEEVAWVTYKEQLLRDSSAEDLVWLKTKAYLRLMDELRAGQSRDAAGEPLGSRLQYGSLPARVVMQPASSEPSDWAPGWDQPRYEPHVAVERRWELTRLIDSMLQPSSTGRDVPPSAPSSLSQQAIMASLPPSVHRRDAGEASNRVVRVDHGDGRVTEYYRDYQDEINLQDELRRQKRQVSSAFAVSFAVGLGMCVFKVLRGKQRGAGGRRPGSPMLPEAS